MDTFESLTIELEGIKARIELHREAVERLNERVTKLWAMYAKVDAKLVAIQMPKGGT